jgi:peptidoglycan/xylan/chitin deacetylase (PgdA/CDA1 family)
MSLRHAARAGFDRAAWLSGILAGRERGMRSGLTILMYHRVLPDRSCVAHHMPSLVMPLGAFREQARWLAEHTRVVTVSDGLRLLASGGRHVPPLVSVTFDDGYADGSALVAPVLEENGVRGTFYVVSGLVGTGRVPWFDRAAAWWRTGGWKQVADAAARLVPGIPVPSRAEPSLSSWMGYLKALADPDRARLIRELLGDDDAATGELDRIMAPDDIRRLARAGHEIGSHSVSHPILPLLDYAELRYEIEASRAQLAGWLDAPPAGFCYPNGDLDERAIEALRRAGYCHACVTRPGLNDPARDPFRLLRFDMNPRRVTRAGTHDTLAMRAEISGLHEVFR